MRAGGNPFAKNADLTKESKQSGADDTVASQAKDENTDVIRETEWLKALLPDRHTMFDIMKRYMVLTGQRVSDPAISSSKTIGELLHKLAAPPKPKKLAQTLSEDKSNGPLAKLGNVKIFQRRVTPIDKEKQVGRWKVIEKELEKRDLPITGHY